MANEYDEISETQPTNKSFAVISDFLKKYTEKNAVDKFFLGDLQKLSEHIAYDEPLTTGKGETLHLKPETLSTLNLLPQSKGAGALAGIGPVGLRALAQSEPELWRVASKLKETLLKVPSADWQTQREIIENTPGFYAVPRGRDQVTQLTPEIFKKYPSTVRYGAEIPDTSLTPSALGRSEGKLPDFFVSPKHYEAYPVLRDFKVKYEPNAASGSGYMNYGNNEIGIGPQTSAQEFLDTLNHEVTHAVQRFEGWPYGTNLPESAKRLVDIAHLDAAGEALPKVLERQTDLARWLRKVVGLNNTGGTVKVPNIIARQEYRRAAGEQLAEAVARSARQGGGKVAANFDEPVSQMYDPYVLDKALKEAVDALNASAGLR